MHREGFRDPGVDEATRASILRFAREVRGGPCSSHGLRVPVGNAGGPAGEFGPRQPTTGKAPSLCEPVGDSCDGHGRQQRRARAVARVRARRPVCSPPHDPSSARRLKTGAGLDVDRRGDHDPPVAEHAHRLLKAASSRESGADVSGDKRETSVSSRLPEPAHCQCGIHAERRSSYINNKLSKIFTYILPASGAAEKCDGR